MATWVEANASPGQGTSPTDLLEPWQITDALTASSISSETVEAMRDAVIGYAASYPTTAPQDLIPLVHRQGRRLAEALSRSQRLAVRRECVQLTAIICSLAANLAIDTDDSWSAAAYFKAAHIAASEAADTELTAWILANQSIQAFFTDRPAVAVGQLERASRTVEADRAPRLAAWISSLLARALARTHEADRARRALEVSRAQLDLAADPADGIVFFDEPRLAGIAGATYLLAGDTAHAEEQLATALKLRSQADRKGRVFLSLDLAACHAAAGDVDRACAIAVQALDLANGTVVRPMVVRAREIQAHLAPYGSSRSTRELEVRVASLDNALGGTVSALD